MAARRKTAKKTTAKKRAPRNTVGLAKVDRKAKHEEALKKLSPIAKNVNARFDSIRKQEGKIDDMRLSAAIELAQAEEICKAEKIQFKKWVEENVEQSYNTCRQLLPIGRAGEEEGAKILMDLRAGNAARNRAHREKKSKASAPTGKGGTTEDAHTRAFNAAQALPDQSQVNIAKTLAAKHGLTVVSAEEDAPAANGEAHITTVDEVKDALLRLSAKDRVTVAKWLAEKIGATLDLSVDGDDDDLDIPSALKREKKAPRKRRTRQAA